MNYEFDIETDGAGTLAFCINENRWRGGDLYESEGLSNVNRGAYSFKDGELWEHNADSANPNTFYGQKYSSFLAFIVSDGDRIKLPKTVSVQGTHAPKNSNIKAVKDETGTELETFILENEFKGKEGVFYADVKRAGTGTKRFNGEHVRGPHVYCLFEFDPDEKMQLRFVNIGYTLSYGHPFI